MNNLQKLIKLRGLSVRCIAKDVGHGYHHVQKVVKGTRYRHRDGSFGTYNNRAVQQAVAVRLGLSYEQAWGAKSHSRLLGLIRKEIKAQARKKERDLQQVFLHNGRLPEKQAVCNV
ncbi:hypothetical protein JYT85_01505 [Desulfocapsa sp. AH-315-G09]|uniref:Uncharacterized protein n=1 Tax=Desulfotalea psychrophila TaxID=84980 RepID=A0ABS3AUJ2_9BACT|nr:hypothetical protein [Desulfocapsa sp.]MBL4904426.1 hypothetical protein [Desulfocapsa sp.]MBN4045995.1 hypothetical protein [bacterium AH-315-P11]MBN4065303.1 hypothetical protein [Desulfocapsa sp. AH-315-G09]MBN4068433.1 hypothetical protein [Desulfotalea psychrophila]